MQNRLELQKDYLQLINTLNTSNRKKNQQTEISFVVRTDSSKTQHLLCTVNNEYYLCLAITNLNHAWVVDVNFEFQNLAKYILKNFNSDNDNINSAIVNSLRRLFSVEPSDQ